MKVLYIGEKGTHDQYVMGNVPSHWLYGAVEMERDGHEVVWAQEGSSLTGDIKLIRKVNPDIVFIPNLNLHNHLLLLLITSLGLLRIPLYGYLHHEPAVKNGIKGKIYRQMLKGLKHVFFLSELTLRRTVESGLLDKDICSVPGWGPDMDFYNKISKSDNGWFVSTGKENRDFDILIKAFRITGAPLHIFTSTGHNGTDYTGLEQKCKGIDNIRVTLVPNSPDNYPKMVTEMASARALVCPLRRDRLNYCVGLSTIADAEGLGKPLIITENPYHAGRRDHLAQVQSTDDWVTAIRNVAFADNNDKSRFSMAKAYELMKKAMNL